MVRWQRFGTDTLKPVGAAWKSSALAPRASACIVEMRHMGLPWIGNYICAAGFVSARSPMDLERYAVPPSWLAATDLVSRPYRWDGPSPPIYVRPRLAPPRRRRARTAFLLAANAAVKRRLLGSQGLV
jgi:hypothetical protein